MVGISFQKNSYDFVTGGLDANGEHALKKNDPLFYYLNYANASATKSVSGETTSNTKYSYFGRLGYDYLGRYMLQASLRADAADLSKLSKKTRWGYFPAVSAGWTITRRPVGAISPPYLLVGPSARRSSSVPSRAGSTV